MTSKLWRWMCTNRAEYSRGKSFYAFILQLISVSLLLKQILGFTSRKREKSKQYGNQNILVLCFCQRSHSFVYLSDLFLFGISPVGPFVTFICIVLYRSPKNEKHSLFHLISMLLRVCCEFPYGFCMLFSAMN